jgi:hypothetical protein
MQNGVNYEPGPHAQAAHAQAGAVPHTHAGKSRNEPKTDVITLRQREASGHLELTFGRLRER